MPGGRAAGGTLSAVLSFTGLLCKMTKVCRSSHNAWYGPSTACLSIGILVTPSDKSIITEVPVISVHKLFQDADRNPFCSVLYCIVWKREHNRISTLIYLGIRPVVWQWYAFSSRNCRLQFKIRDAQVESQIKWTSLLRTVYQAVVGLHKCRNACVPVLQMIINIATQYGYQDPVVSFYLLIGLWIV